MQKEIKVEGKKEKVGLGQSILSSNANAPYHITSVKWKGRKKKVGIIVERAENLFYCALGFWTKMRKKLQKYNVENP